MATAADLLTGLRFALSIAIFLVTAAGILPATSVLVAAAWLTDLLDGRLARRAKGETRLGSLDPIVDALVGVAIIAGLARAGSLAVGVAVIVIGGLGAWYLMTRIVTLLMILQALAYATLFWHFYQQQTDLWWVSVGVAMFITAVDARRLFSSILPVFFGGFRRLVLGDDARSEVRSVDVAEDEA